MSLRVVSVRTLGKMRKYVLLASFIIAAIITPSADPVNQTIVGLPLYIMYELGLLASWLFIRRKKKKEPPDESEEDD